MEHSKHLCHKLKVERVFQELRKQIASILNFNDALEELVADLEFQLNLTESEQFEDQRIFERAGLYFYSIKNLVMNKHNLGIF